MTDSRARARKIQVQSILLNQKARMCSKNNGDTLKKHRGVLIRMENAYFTPLLPLATTKTLYRMCEATIRGLWKGDGAGERVRKPIV